MGQFRELEDEDGLSKALEERACPTCRRQLMPWEDTCPQDGAAAVPRTSLGSVEDDIISRLAVDLDDDADDADDAVRVDPDGQPAGGTGGTAGTGRDNRPPPSSAPPPLWPTQGDGPA